MSPSIEELVDSDKIREAQAGEPILGKVDEVNSSGNVKVSFDFDVFDSEGKGIERLYPKTEGFMKKENMFCFLS